MLEFGNRQRPRRRRRLAFTLRKMFSSNSINTNTNTISGPRSVTILSRPPFASRVTLPMPSSAAAYNSGHGSLERSTALSSSSSTNMSMCSNHIRDSSAVRRQVHQPVFGTQISSNSTVGDTDNNGTAEHHSLHAHQHGNPPPSPIYTSFGSALASSSGQTQPSQQSHNHHHHFTHGNTISAASQQSPQHATHDLHHHMQQTPQQSFAQHSHGHVHHPVQAQQLQQSYHHQRQHSDVSQHSRGDFAGVTYDVPFVNHVGSERGSGDAGNAERHSNDYTVSAMASVPIHVAQDVSYIRNAASASPDDGGNEYRSATIAHMSREMSQVAGDVATCVHQNELVISLLERLVSLTENIATRPAQQARAVTAPLFHSITSGDSNNGGHHDRSSSSSSSSGQNHVTNLTSSTSFNPSTSTSAVASTPAGNRLQLSSPVVDRTDIGAPTLAYLTPTSEPVSSHPTASSTNHIQTPPSTNTPPTPPSNRQLDATSSQPTFTVKLVHTQTHHTHGEQQQQPEEQQQQQHSQQTYEHVDEIPHHSTNIQLVPSLSDTFDDPLNFIATPASTTHHQSHQLSQSNQQHHHHQQQHLFPGKSMVAANDPTVLSGNKLGEGGGGGGSIASAFRQAAGLDVTSAATPHSGPPRFDSSPSSALTSMGDTSVNRLPSPVFSESALAADESFSAFDLNIGVTPRRSSRRNSLRRQQDTESYEGRSVAAHPLSQETTNLLVGDTAVEEANTTSITSPIRTRAARIRRHTTSEGKPSVQLTTLSGRSGRSDRSQDAGGDEARVTIDYAENGEDEESRTTKRRKNNTVDDVRIEAWSEWQVARRPASPVLRALPRTHYRTIKEVRQERQAKTNRAMASIGRIPLREYMELPGEEYRAVRRLARSLYTQWLEPNVRLAKQDRGRLSACINKIEHTHPLLGDCEGHWKARELMLQVIDNHIDESRLLQRKGPRHVQIRATSATEQRAEPQRPSAADAQSPPPPRKRGRPKGTTASVMARRREEENMRLMSKIKQLQKGEKPNNVKAMGRDKRNDDVDEYDEGNHEDEDMNDDDDHEEDEEDEEYEEEYEEEDSENEEGEEEEAIEVGETVMLADDDASPRRPVVMARRRAYTMGDEHGVAAHQIEPPPPAPEPTYPSTTSPGNETLSSSALWDASVASRLYDGSTPGATGTSARSSSLFGHPSHSEQRADWTVAHHGLLGSAVEANFPPSPRHFLRRSNNAMVAW